MRILTAKEAAKLLGVSVAHIYAMVESGKLRAQSIKTRRKKVVPEFFERLGISLGSIAEYLREPEAIRRGPKTKIEKQKILEKLRG